MILENSIRIEASDKEQYRIVQFLGSGGNCQVYLAISTKGKWQGILFAIKFFLKIEDKERLLQFEKEKDFLSKASHPCVMKIYSDGTYYLATQDRKIPFVVCDYFPERLDWKIRNKKLQSVCEYIGNILLKRKKSLRLNGKFSFPMKIENNPLLIFVVIDFIFLMK